jgi:sortase A
VAPTTPPPATGQPVGIIDIPSIGLDQVVVEGVGTAQLRSGPGHYPGTPLPGQAGNAAIAGHRTTYGHPFYDLNAVEHGARVVLTTPQGIFVYAAGKSSVVDPTDDTVLASTSDAQLTLTTCNPRYSASTRLVLRAYLVSSTLFPNRPHQATVPTTTVPTSKVTQAVKGTSLAGSGNGSWLSAVLWGLAVAAVVIATWLLARRTRRRWPLYVLGGLATLVVLFFFFTAISPLLPASV